MVTRVYQYGLLPPTENESIVREQLRAAHDYRNDLVAIERGRRDAIRAIDSASEEVREAASVLRAATKSTRKAALREVAAARKRARADAAERLAEIAELEHELLLSAREYTACFWGTYLDVEAGSRQSRKQPLYGDDGLAPNGPAFTAGPRWAESFATDDPRGFWWLREGQVGVQLQGGLPVEELIAGGDTRARLTLGEPGRRGRRYGTLQIRVGSNGRAPAWATWPIKTHRDLPAGGVVKWVRVSVRPEGLRERWTVEFSVEAPAAPRVGLPTAGVAAIEWEWSPIDGGGIRVARWCDDRGGAGEIVLPATIATGITKPNGIRAVRDLVLNEMRERLPQLIRAEASAPAFAREAANTMHLWKSPQRFRALAMRWRLHLGSPVVRWSRRTGEVCELRATHPAFSTLAEWERRDAHLYDYEAGSRGEVLRERREFYRVIAAEWRRRYAKVLVSDQDLSREARWGDDSDVRFVAGPSELRITLRNAFGDDAIDSRWRDSPDEDNEREWCERTRDAWTAGGARGDGRFAALKAKTTNAWAARKAKATERRAEKETAREEEEKATE